MNYFIILFTILLGQFSNAQSLNTFLVTVFPGWEAVLPVGPSKPLPVFWHNLLMAEPGSLDPVVAELLRP